MSMVYIYIVILLMSIFLVSSLLFQFGKQHFEEVENTTVTCRVLEGVECHGNRTFLKRNVPCVR